MPSMPPPIADRRPIADTRHGHTRVDPYAWLRDDNWQQVMKEPAVLAADIRAYLEAENAYADGVLAPIRPLQRRLFDEMKGRIKEDDSSVPLPDGPYSYHVRYRAGGQHPLFCRVAADGIEQVMIDGDREAEGRAFLRFAGCEHSPDHRLLARQRRVLRRPRLHRPELLQHVQQLQRHRPQPRAQRVLRQLRRQQRHRLLALQLHRLRHHHRRHLWLKLRHRPVRVQWLRHHHQPRRRPPLSLPHPVRLQRRLRRNRAVDHHLRHRPRHRLHLQGRQVRHQLPRRW